MKRLVIMMALAISALGVSAQTRGTVKQEGGYTNIRKGPGTNYPIVAKVKDGSSIYYSAGTNGWYKVYTDKMQFSGYVSASKIVTGNSRSNANANSTILKQYAFVKQEGGYTNIRKGPGSSYAIVEKVKDGSTIIVDTSFNSWVRVFRNNGSLIGYISASKLEYIESETFY